MHLNYAQLAWRILYGLGTVLMLAAVVVSGYRRAQKVADRVTPPATDAVMNGVIVFNLLIFALLVQGYLRA
jgi:hypothetical protein